MVIKLPDPFSPTGRRRVGSGYARLGAWLVEDIGALLQQRFIVHVPVLRKSKS